MLIFLLLFTFQSKSGTPLMVADLVSGTQELDRNPTFLLEFSGSSYFVGNTHSGLGLYRLHNNDISLVIQCPITVYGQTTIQLLSKTENQFCFSVNSLVVLTDGTVNGSHFYNMYSPITAIQFSGSLYIFGSESSIVVDLQSFQEQPHTSYTFFSGAFVADRLYWVGNNYQLVSSDGLSPATPVVFNGPSNEQIYAIKPIPGKNAAMVLKENAYFWFDPGQKTLTLPGFVANWISQMETANGKVFALASVQNNIQLRLLNAPPGTSPLLTSFLQAEIIGTNSTGIFLFANDGTSGKEFWFSDGTAAGTLLLDDSTPGPASSSKQHVSVFNEELYFSRDHLIYALGQTSGSPQLRYSFREGGAVYSKWAAFSQGVFMGVKTFVQGIEAAYFDGTTLMELENLGSVGKSGSYYHIQQSSADGLIINESQGTQIIAEPGAVPEAWVAAVHPLSAVVTWNHNQYFVTASKQLCRYNANEGITLLKQSPLNNGTYDFFESEGYLWLVAQSSSNSAWRIDPSDQVVHLNTYSLNGPPQQLGKALYVGGNTVVLGSQTYSLEGSNFYYAHNLGDSWYLLGNSIERIQLEDGSLSHENVADLSAYTLRPLTFVLDQSIFFFSNSKMYRFDTTNNQINWVRDLPGYYVGSGTLLEDNSYIFSVYDGYELSLWRTRGTTDHTYRYWHGEGSSLVGVDGEIYFVHYEPDTGTELWVSNGSQTSIFQDMEPGPLSSNPEFVDQKGNLLFFSFDTQTYGREVYTWGGGKQFGIVAPEFGCLDSLEAHVRPSLWGGQYLWTLQNATAESVLTLDQVSFSPDGLGDIHISCTLSGPFHASQSLIQTIELQANPGTTPVEITGPASVCAAEEVAYSVNPILGETYTWLVTGDAVIHGQGPSISLSVGLESFSLSVMAETSCGMSLPQTLDVTVDQPPIVNAGSDQTLCGTTSVQLSASPPVGQWEIVYGTGGSLDNASNPEATFTGTSGVYFLAWTVDGGSCGPFQDLVQIQIISPPQLDAGPDRVICGTSTNLQAQSTVAGMWSVLSGSGGYISQSTNPNSHFSGTAGTTYELQWTSVDCANVFDTVSIQFTAYPPNVPLVFEDFAILDQPFPLPGYLPPSASGQWDIAQAPSYNYAQFSDTHVPEASFTPDGVMGIYNLLWSLIYPACPAQNWSVRLLADSALKYPTARFSGSINPSITRFETGDFFYFWRSQSGQYELWRSDGSPSGTSQVFTLTGVSSLSSQQIGTRLWYTFYRSGSYELWTCDGTMGGEVQLFVGNHPYFRGHFGSKLVFEVVGQVWVSDGTPSGTEAWNVPGFERVSFSNPLFFDNRWIFTGPGSLWASDGTQDGTSVFYTISEPNQYPQMTLWQGQLLATSEENSHRTIYQIDAMGNEQIVFEGDYAQFSMFGATSDYLWLQLNSTIYARNDQGTLVSFGSPIGLGEIQFWNDLFVYRDYNSRHFLDGDPAHSFSSSLFRYADPGKTHWFSRTSDLWVTDGTEQGTSLYRTLPSSASFLAQGAQGFLINGQPNGYLFTNEGLQTPIPLAIQAPDCPGGVWQLEAPPGSDLVWTGRNVAFVGSHQGASVSFQPLAPEWMLIQGEGLDAQGQPVFVEQRLSGMTYPVWFWQSAEHYLDLDLNGSISILELMQTNPCEVAP
ncbi:MAG: hypothetical protein H6510_16740 [Acidobacteria bacterium]|nr:hypothetical protein [Acidobacteriota bacterium]MCB9399463.1 hypothetical protein [Acidobacteriota bacterium]